MAKEKVECFVPIQCQQCEKKCKSNYRINMAHKEYFDKDKTRFYCPHIQKNKKGKV